MQDPEQGGDGKSGLKVALCGIGDHAIENIVPALRQVLRLSVRTAVTRDAAKRGRLREMLPDCAFVERLADIPDSTNLIVAAGPPVFNLEALEAAERIGAAVFLEKPLAPGFAFTDPNILMQVGYNLSFSSSLQRFNSLKESYGKIEYLRIKYNTNKPREIFWDLSDVAESFLYAIGCHPIHLAASVFGFDGLVHASLVSREADVFLDVMLRHADGTVCTVSSHNRAPSLELEVEAHFELGPRVTLTDLRHWRTSSPAQPKDAFSGRRSDACGTVSSFNMSEDITGFVGQFHDIADRIGSRTQAHPLVGHKAAMLTNELIKCIIDQSARK